MDPKRPRLLLVAYDFPPIVSAGMIRVAAMTKYLQRLGWDVTVLTVRDSFVQRSEWAMGLVPATVPVIRTRCFEPLQTVKRLRARGAEAGTITRVLLRTLAMPMGWLSRLLAVPDRKVGWFLPLLLRAGRELRRGHYDAVLSTSPPHSSHLPLLLLRRFVRFRWIVDFRDPWTAPRRLHFGQRGSALERRLERAVLAAADGVVANTPGNKAAIAEEFPGVDAEKIEVVTNGFDTEWLDPNPPPAEPECDLVYTGHIYPHMLDVILPALRRLRDCGRTLPTIWVFGDRPQHLQPGNDVDEFFAFKGRVTFTESLSVMRRARGLLYLIPNGVGYETWVPSKLYPYLFSDTPIFAVVPDGDAARIVSSTGSGVTVVDGAVDSVVRELERFMDGALSPGGGRNRDELSHYAWDHLSRRIDAVLRGTGVA